MSVFSDSRFRAYSLSSGHPVGLLDLSYDHPSGAYAGLSASVVASSDDGLRPLGLQLNAGYAKRVSDKLTVDGGIVHAEFSHYANNAVGYSYTEVYAGFTHQALAGRLSFSPHYFRSGTSTLYGELNDAFALAPKLDLNAHVGLLTPVGNSSGSRERTEFDWRIGLARRFGRLSAQVAWTGGKRLNGYGGGRPHTDDTIVLGLSWVL